MKNLIILALLISIFSCKENYISEKNSPNIKNKILVIIDDYIKMDSIKQFNDNVFKVIVSKRYDYSLIRIFPVKYKSQLLSDIPNYSFIRNGKVILVFNGLEDIVSTDSIYNIKFISQTEQYLVDDMFNDNEVPSKTFDPIVWEILVKDDSVTLNKMPVNAYDYVFPVNKFVPPIE